MKPEQRVSRDILPEGHVSTDTWRKVAATSGIIRVLELGCGPPPLPNHCGADEVYGIDLFEDDEHRIRRADLAVEPIPFDDSFFDVVIAENFIEHIPRLIYAPSRRYPFVELMNEIWRVLRPGGVFLSATPAYPEAAVFRDPTHVNFITEETWAYFCQDTPEARLYGFKGAFSPIGQGWKGYLLITHMEKM